MGLLFKGTLASNKKTYIYSLTEKGVDLLPVIVEYILWSDKYLHDHIAEGARQFASLLKKNKTSVIQEARKKLLTSQSD